MKILKLFLIVLFFTLITTAQDEQAISKRIKDNLAARRYDAAIADYTELIRLRPLAAGYYYGRGFCYILQISVKKETQQEYIARINKISSGDTTTKSQMSLNAINDLNKAAELYQQMLPSVNDSKRAEIQQIIAELYYLRGWVYEKEIDYAPAIADFQRVLTIAPNFTKTLENKTLREILSKAKNDYAGWLDTQALKLKNNLDLSLMGDLMTPPTAEQLKQREAERAKIRALYLKAAENYQPADGLTYRSRALVYMILENWTAAIADYKEALRFSPNDWGLLSSLAHVYAGAGQFPLAIAEYEKIINSPQSTEGNKEAARYDLAKTWIKAGRADEALRFFSDFIAKEPEGGHHYLHRGTAYAKKGNKQLARNDFNKAIELAKTQQFGINTIIAAQKELEILDGKSKPVTESKSTVAPSTVKSNQPVWRKTNVTDMTKYQNLYSYKQANGVIYHLCRAEYAGGTHPGLVFANACNIGYGGQEIAVSQFEVYLINDNPDYEITLEKRGESFVIGREANNNPLIYCQVFYQNFTLPGKIVNGNCNFTWNKKELYSSNYSTVYLAAKKSSSTVTSPSSSSTATNSQQALPVYVPQAIPEPFESNFQREMREANNQPNPSQARSNALVNLFKSLKASGKPTDELMRLLLLKIYEVCEIDFYAFVYPFYEDFLMNRSLVNGQETLAFTNVSQTMEPKELGVALRTAIRQRAMQDVENYQRRQKGEPLANKVFAQPGVNWRGEIKSPLSVNPKPAPAPTTSAAASTNP